MTIQPSDIEAKAREIQAALDETRESAQNTAVLAGVAVALFLVLAFFFGRRKGKKSRAVIEIYRV
ncbi:MAG TPA: LPXTG cell wall anchor domain-containing protein [Acidimicrobiia bacterium]|jgi:LPXTG-motif cell wall-anchored protein|nr:LPXTG cell wall anchor domain-containing protein [Acidimicrobiia bacterium]